MKGNRRKKELAPLLIVLLQGLIVVPPALAQEKHPFAGTWKANLAKSQRHENHQFKSATMQFEIAGDVVIIAFKGVNMAGKEEAGKQTLHADGKEHSIAEAPGFIVITKWANPNRLESVGKKDGTVNGQSAYEVSADRKTLTASVKGIDGKGRPFEQVIVFDREEP